MQTTRPRSDYERERGKPLPSKLHSITQLNLCALLSQYRSKYTSFSELSLELEGWQGTPDLSIYPRMEIDFTQDEVRMRERPLVAIEIASPTQSVQEMVDKIRDMLKAGISSCWLVQPTLQTVTIFSGKMKSQTFSEGTVRDPATDIEIAIRDIFAVE